MIQDSEKQNGHAQTFPVNGYGFRAGGRTYRPGQSAPIQYKAQLERPSQAKDPAVTLNQLPPNAGRNIIPHIWTFAGRVSTVAQTYRNHDEAIRHSVRNAHAMLLDPMIMGPLLARQTMVSLLNWSIEPEDDRDPVLKEMAKQLTTIVERTPYFRQYLRTLQESIWYGRYAIQNRYSRVRDKRTGRIQYHISGWTPVSGDKLIFRYDDGSGKYDSNQIGVKVSPAFVKNDIWTGHPDLEFAHDGAILFFQRWQRRRIVVHKHLIRDGEFEDPLSGSQIHGVGLRNFLYWTWFQKAETMAQLVETVEKTASGITVFYYPDGNPAAKAQVTELAENASHNNVLILPYDATDPGSYSVQQIPANTQGISALQELIDRYFGDWILRFILGQTLSQRADSTGLGSGNSDLQHDSLKQIIKFDAANAEETLTREFLDPLVRLNFPRYASAQFNFRLHPESNIPQDELAAIESGWNMGLKLKAADVYDKIGIGEPGKDDEAIFNPQVRQAIEQANVPQLPGGGMPGLPPGMAQPMGAPDPNAPVPQPPGAMPISIPGDDSNLQQMQQGDPEQQRKQKIFGPILNAKARANWDAIDWSNSTRKPRNFRERAIQYARNGFQQPKRYAVRHAPAGGVTIGGVEYPGGRFIPDEALAKATPEELSQLQGSQPHQVQSHEHLSELPKGFELRKRDGSVWKHNGQGNWDNTTGMGEVWGPAHSSEIFDEEAAASANKQLGDSHAGLVKHATENHPDTVAAKQQAEQAKRYDPKQIKPHEALDELPEGTQIGPWSKKQGFWHHSRSKAILSSMSAAHGKQALDDDTLRYAAALVAQQRQQQDAAQQPGKPEQPAAKKGSDEQRQQSGKPEQRQPDPQQEAEIARVFGGAGGAPDESGGEASDMGTAEPQATESGGGSVDSGAGGPGEGADTGGDAAEAAGASEAGQGSVDVGSLESLPPGSTVTDRNGLKWQKQPPHEAFPSGIWTIHPDSNDAAVKQGVRGGDAMPHERMASMADPDTIQAAAAPDAQQPAPGARQQQAALWDEHGEDLKDLARSFGIEAFDGHQQQRVQNFLTQQAREAGYEPQGNNATEKAIDAAQHLAGNIQSYQGVIDYARSLGFNGNAKRLGAQFRQSGQAIISMANKSGANIDPSSNPSDQLTQAIQHLQQQGDAGNGGDGASLFEQLADAFGGRNNLFMVAGILFATWAFYRLMDNVTK